MFLFNFIFALFVSSSPHTSPMFSSSLAPLYVPSLVSPVLHWSSKLQSVFPLLDCFFICLFIHLFSSEVAVSWQKKGDVCGYTSQMKKTQIFMNIGLYPPNGIERCTQRHSMDENQASEKGRQNSIRR